MARFAVVLLALLVGCVRKQESPAAIQTAKDHSPEPGLVPAKEPPFAAWPKPAVALVITGQMTGYIEPCGCTGLENQKGGLARRHMLIKQLVDEHGWPVISL